MFIHPIYQGKGIAQKVLILIEEMFPEATELGTCYNFRRRTKLFSIRKNGV